MDTKDYYNTCEKCGRPMQYATEPKCNYCDSCMSEYCGCKLGRIKEIEPTCDSTAVIPSITVESVEGITNLANCLVHVTSTNTTYYVDDKHRIMITWAGPVNIPGYDMERNPEKFKDQIVTDVEAETAVIYDNHGKGYIFGITPKNLQQAINDKLDEMAADGTLESIIAHYLPLGYTLSYDTITEMKNATNYEEGSCCLCLGNTSLDDGGTSLFKIRVKTGSDVIDETSIYALANSETLIAEKIIPNIEREDESRVSVKSEYSYDLKSYYTVMSIPKSQFSINLVYYWDSYQDGVYKYVHEHPGSVYSNGPLKSPTIIDGQIKINAVPSDSEYWYILGTDANGDIKYTKDVYREKTGSQLKGLGYQNCFGIWCPIRINGAAFDASAELNHSDPNYNYIINSNIPMCIFGYDNDNYYLIVVEGRNPRSLGIRFNQAVTLMEELNIPNAFNMDGGGSCELWASNPTVNLVYGDKNVATLGYSSHRAWELIKFTKES